MNSPRDTAPPGASRAVADDQVLPVPGPMGSVADGETGVASAIRRAGEVSWWFVGVSIVVGVSAWLLWQARVILAPLLIGGLIVLVLSPMVAVLVRRGVPRMLAVVIAYLGVLVPAGFGAFLVSGVVVDQAEELAELWPEVWADLERWAVDVDSRIEDRGFDFSIAEALDRIEDGDWVGDAVQQAFRLGLGALGAIAAWLIGVFMGFYLLADMPRLRETTMDLLPPSTRQHLTVMSGRVRFALAGFVRGQLFVAFMVGLMTAVGLWAIDLPSWLLLGGIAGIGNLVPFIGPIVGGIPAVVIALATRDLATALWAAGIMFVVQQIESYLLSPLVLRKTTRIHPVLAMLAIMLGGLLFGIPGMLLAVPVTLTIQIVTGYLWRVFIVGQSPEEAAAVSGPPVVGEASLENEGADLRA